MNAGDVVYLNSGGPALTVLSVDGNGLVSVQWFAGAEYRSAQFPTASLTATDPTPGIQTAFSTALQSAQQAANLSPAQSVKAGA